MTDDLFRRQLSEVLDSLAPRRMPDYLDEVLARTARTRQRRAWILRRVALDDLLEVRRTRLLVALALLVLALAISLTVGVGSGLVRLPWTSDRFIGPPGGVDTCALLRRGVLRAGQYGAGSGGGMFPNDDAPGWEAHGCAYGYDGGWNDPHLLLRARATSAEEATGLIDSWVGPPAVLQWTKIAGMSWEGDSGESDRVWSAVAVSYEPYFFVVTGRDRRAARLLSLEVEYELFLGHTGFGELQDRSLADRAACSLISERFLSERYGPGLFHIVEWRNLSTDWALAEEAPTKLGPGSGRCLYFHETAASTLPYVEVFVRGASTTSLEAEALAESLLGSRAVAGEVAGRPAWRLVEDPEHPFHVAIAVVAEPHFIIVSAAIAGEPMDAVTAEILRTLATEALANLDTAP